MVSQGFRVVRGIDDHNHSFGGEHWSTPECPNCETKMHLIFTFDLCDKRLEMFGDTQFDSIPLISCLNCSGYWSPQVFHLNPDKRSISIVEQCDKENWISDEEDKLPYPLPYSSMKLVKLQTADVPEEAGSDRAFELFGTEYVCRLLGAPLFAMDHIHKKCSQCGEDMGYVAMICSEDYDSVGLLHEGFCFNFGESFLYFYFCKTCKLIATEMQST